MKATERLWLTAKKDRVVEDGDPKAAFLYAAPGDEIPAAAAERFGLVDGGLKRVNRKPAAPPVKTEAKPVNSKSKKPAANKARKPEEDKAAKPDADKSADPDGDPSTGSGQGGLKIERQPRVEG